MPLVMGVASQCNIKASQRIPKNSKEHQKIPEDSRESKIFPKSSWALLSQTFLRKISLRFLVACCAYFVPNRCPVLKIEFAIIWWQVYLSWICCTARQNQFDKFNLCTKWRLDKRELQLRNTLLPWDKVLHLDKCYIWKSVTFGQVLHLYMCYIRTSVTFENVSDLDKCYIWTTSDAIQWKSGIPACTLRRHIGMEVTQQLGFARIQPALSCSALALKCARTLCSINGRDQNAMHYIGAWKLSCPPVSISL